MADNKISEETMTAFEKRNALLVKGNVFHETQDRFIKLTTVDNLERLKNDEEQLYLLIEFFAKMEHMRSVLLVEFTDGSYNVGDSSLSVIGKFYLDLYEEYIEKSNKLHQYKESQKT